MGIFKETLNPYLANQLKARQKIISTHSNRAATPAFHAYTTNKYCNIRMASGVDITTDELLELDLEISGVKLETDLRGYGLAKNYILQGGTLLNPKGSKNPTMRQGFPGKGRPLGRAYGDPLMRGDAKDGYGIVPMPGITKISVRTKSAYGSLKEAKVDFVCHNLRQLAVLEILYMRPGYPVLLEWCWDPYIDNNGKVVSGTDVSQHYLSNNIDFFKGKLSQKYVCAELARHRKLSFGNYDGILGLCKNFSYTARPDGGFNCTTELMAVGESISVIKGKDHVIHNVEVPITNERNDTTILNKSIRLPHLLDFLEKTHDYIYSRGRDPRSDDSLFIRYDGDDDLLQTEDDEIKIGKNFNRSAAYHDTPIRRGDMWITFHDDKIKIYNKPYREVKKLYHDQYFGKNESGGDEFSTTEGIGSFFKEMHIMHFTKDRPKWKVNAASTLVAIDPLGISMLGSIARAWLSTTADKAIVEGYIRLDALCFCMNWFCMNKVPKYDTERQTVFQTLNYNPAKAGTKNALRMNTFKRYKGDLEAITINQVSTVQWNPGVIDMSTDPYVCLMPGQLVDKHRDYDNSTQYCLPVQNQFGYPDGPSPYSFDEQFKKCFPLGNTNVFDESLHSIGHIMVNLRFLLKCHDDIFEKGKENSDYSIGKFMQKVLDGINNTMGNGLKLSMTTDNQFPNVTQIVDLNQSPKTPYNNLFTFNVLSDNSVVRQFSFNSAVPSSMASTIAVGAGDPDNVSDLDGVTFAAMNRGIKNRLYQPESAGKTRSQLSAAEKEELKFQHNKDYNELITLGNTITDYQLMIQSGTILDNNDQNKKEMSLAKGNLTRFQSLVNKLAVRDENGIPLKNINPPASTPIPIKLDMVLDGISGMVIGQLFRVEESRLPLQYRNKEICFVVVAEEQSVDENGKWTTKISGQMQLFPKEVQPKPPSEQSIQLNEFRDKVPGIAEELQKALITRGDYAGSGDDDEAKVRDIFFNRGYTDQQLQLVGAYFNEQKLGTFLTFEYTLEDLIERDYAVTDFDPGGLVGGAARYFGVGNLEDPEKLKEEAQRMLRKLGSDKVL